MRFRNLLTSSTLNLVVFIAYIYIKLLYCRALSNTTRLREIMDHQAFDYSMKNIPIPSRKFYLKCLIEKTELVIKRMRWKALITEKNTGSKSSYGFKSRKCPQQHPARLFKTYENPVPDLVNFENDLLGIIKSVSFETVRNDFQDKLRTDMSTIISSDKAFVFADKTRNLYKLDKAAYGKLYMENVTKSYKRVDSNVYHDINLEAKGIATELKIGDEVERMAKKEAFVTLKDHKDDFNINPKCHLINPAKSKLGKVSKTIIENINNKVKANAFNQWKKTDDVIRWFSNIRDKANCVFIQFDIPEFYPSISKDLQKSLEYAKQFTNIPPKDIYTLMHARKSLLFAKKKRLDEKLRRQFF